MFFNKELKAGEGGGTDPSDIILFMFFGLLMGVITLQVLSRLGDPLPYTVVMFFLGIVFSFNTDFHGSTGMWGDSIYKWSRIDADMMLYIFLPPLIFGEAMNLNWFFVQNAFLQSCLLAGPGVVLTTVFMGVICRVILPYHWSWYLCFTFGAVVSASDTVAVLSIMKESGASPKLTMLIVGESLLNDGTAIVLFALFFDLLMGKHYTPGEIILFFPQLLSWFTIIWCGLWAAHGSLVAHRQSIPQRSGHHHPNLYHDLLCLLDLLHCAKSTRDIGSAGLLRSWCDVGMAGTATDSQP
jgi:NhaP-type Na+/H+ or K+/H+ antiporter